MAWTGIWSYQVDGTELNDNVNFVSFVPEIHNVQPQQVILADVDGDYPKYIRSQPQAGSYTFLIAMKNAGTEALWYSRYQTLQTLFDPTSYHTLSVQARGMTDRQEVQFIVESMQPDYKTRTVVVSAVAPNPNLVTP